MENSGTKKRRVLGLLLISSEIWRSTACECFLQPANELWDFDELPSLTGFSGFLNRQRTFFELKEDTGKRSKNI